MTVAYKAHTIDTRAFGGEFLAFVVDDATSKVIRDLPGQTEASAVDRAKLWIDAYLSVEFDHKEVVDVPVPIDKGGSGQITALAAFNALAGSGGVVTGDLDVTGTLDVTSNLDVDANATADKFLTDNALGAGSERVRHSGSTGDFRLYIQDGTGRVLAYWNAVGGTVPTFINGGEHAGKVRFQGGNIQLLWADGTGTSDDDPITWEEQIQITDQYLYCNTLTALFRGKTGDPQKSYGISIEGSNVATGAGGPAISVLGATNLNLRVEQAGTGELHLGNGSGEIDLNVPTLEVSTTFVQSHRMILEVNGTQYYIALDQV